MKCSILASLLFFTTTSFAYINGKIPVSENKFSCPLEIICESENNNINCHYSTDHPEYWEPKIYNHKPKALTYKFGFAYAYYHKSGPFTRPVECGYWNDQDLQAIHIQAKNEANLESDINAQNTKWKKDNKDHLQICASANPKDCLLKQKYGFVIHNLNIDSISTLVNSINVGEKIISGDYAYVTIDQVIEQCSTLKECKIDLYYSPNSILLGSITVDVENKMKIVSITKNSPYLQIKKVDPFNAIEIGYDEKSFVIRKDVA